MLKNNKHLPRISYIFNGKLFPYPNYAGTERMVVWELEWLAQNGYKVNVIIPYKNHSSFLVPEIIRLNHKIITFEEKLLMSFWEDAIECAEKLDSELILTRGGAIESKYFNDCNIPTIMTVDGCMILNDDVDYFFAPHSNFKFRFLSQTHFNYCTRGIKASQDSSFWVYHGLPDSCFLQPNKAQIENERLSLAHLQSFKWGVVLKGLIDFCTLAQNNPQHTFLAFGCGDDEIGYGLKRFGVQCPNFNFLGMLDNETKPTTFANVGGFFMGTVSPYQEPFGLTQIEAMACGCPVFYLRKNHGNNGTISEIQSIDVGAPISLISENGKDLEKLLDIDRRDVYGVAREYFQIGDMMRGIVNKFN